MSPLRETPKAGDVVTYWNRKAGVQVPVRIVKVAAAVCLVEILAGGLDDSLKGKQLRTHVSLLFKQY